ncbi:hypothetical protein Q5752_004538 [Cryptotrichosporon argae]
MTTRRRSSSPLGAGGFAPSRTAPAPPPLTPPLTLLHPSPSRPYSARAGESDAGGAEATPGLGSDGRGARDGRRGRLRPFEGMYRDVRARLPWYASDWTDACNYRVVPSTWFIFFANVFPGIAFSLDLIETTNEYGVQEVLLASFMAAFVAAVLGGQPLLISGVTGPITVFNKTIYDIFRGRQDFNYLHFMGWVYLWGAILHWLAAGLNAVHGLRYVTRFACDTFGFYVSAVYVQYGIQTVTRQFARSSTPAAFLGIILALVTLVLPHYFTALARSGYGNKHFRRFCADYGMPITVVAATGLAYWGRFDAYVREPNMTLPTTDASFEPANGRAWLIRFWQLDAQYVGIALPFGIVLFILFYFDANVSSLIAQGSEYPLRKPAAFHWDFFLLGITTFIAGLLGVPAPNGLIPQAPLHTASLVVMGEGAGKKADAEQNAANSVPLSAVSARAEDGGASASVSAGSEKDGETASATRQVPVAVVEQRVSNLAQGCLCLILMTKPFEHVLGLIPKGVLAGLFWYMGTDALLGSGVTEKLLYLARERAATPADHPLHAVRASRIALFTAIELVGFGATFAITQTIAAIGFPVIIMLLVPVRALLVPRLGFTPDELAILDGPVASPFTMESVTGHRGRAPSPSRQTD